MIRASQLPDNEISMTAIHASGPGGQNVNKVATAIALRFDIHASSLPNAVKLRLLALRDHRVTADGVVVIKASRFRYQERNREDALERLDELLLEAQHVQKPRKATRPTASSRARRLDDKKKRGVRKQLRGPIAQD